MSKPNRPILAEEAIWRHHNLLRKNSRRPASPRPASPRPASPCPSPTLRPGYSAAHAGYKAGYSATGYNVAKDNSAGEAAAEAAFGQTQSSPSPLGKKRIQKPRSPRPASPLPGHSAAKAGYNAGRGPTGHLLAKDDPAGEAEFRQTKSSPSPMGKKPKQNRNLLTAESTAGERRGKAPASNARARAKQMKARAENAEASKKDDAVETPIEGTSKKEDAVEAPIEGASDEVSSVAEVCNEQAIDALPKGASAETADERRATLESLAPLAKSGDEKAIEALLEGVSDEVSAVRGFACQCLVPLADLGNERAIAALFQASCDADSAVCRDVLASVRSLTMNMTMRCSERVFWQFIGAGLSQRCKVSDGILRVDPCDYGSGKATKREIGVWVEKCALCDAETDMVLEALERLKSSWDEFEIHAGKRARRTLRTLFEEDNNEEDILADLALIDCYTAVLSVGAAVGDPDAASLMEALTAKTRHRSGTVQRGSMMWSEVATC